VEVDVVKECLSTKLLHDYVKEELLGIKKEENCYKDAHYLMEEFKQLNEAPIVRDVLLLRKEQSV
jgi:hypothetical protein